MKKTILSLIAVLILGVGAYFVSQKSDVKTTMNIAETDFSVTDTSQITRFFIAKKDGSSYLFSKNENNDWIVNNSWKANPFMVNMLLGTIYEIRVKAPVPKGMRNGVIKTLAAQGTKVELYNADGLIKTFYVGDYTSDEEGTYFIMEGSEQPYIIHIPRLKGYVSGRFNIKKDDFIDQAIFLSKSNHINEVEVTYNNDIESGFKIVNSELLNAKEEVDTSKINTYLSNFTTIYSETIIKPENAKQQAYMDSILSEMPTVVIRVKDKDDSKSNEIKLYDVNNNDRMIGYIPKWDRKVWVQYYGFNKLLVKKKYFYKIAND